MDHVSPTRRRILSYGTDLLLLILGLLVAIPAVGYVFAPLWRRAGGAAAATTFLDAGPLQDLPLDQWHLVRIEVVQRDGWKKTRVQHSIWVRRRGQETQDITVLSPICPHLGCPVSWHPTEREFVCPCHGGIFDANGRHIAGPPPRSMDSLEFEVHDEHLWVRWEDFRIGTTERIPVSV